MDIPRMFLPSTLYTIEIDIHHHESLGSGWSQCALRLPWYKKIQFKNKWSKIMELLAWLCEWNQFFGVI